MLFDLLVELVYWKDLGRMCGLGGLLWVVCCGRVGGWWFGIGVDWLGDCLFWGLGRGWVCWWLGFLLLFVC